MCKTKEYAPEKFLPLSHILKNKKKAPSLVMPNNIFKDRKLVFSETRS